MKLSISRSARASETRVHAIRRRGTAAVEFALALPVFLTFVFGIVEIGRIRMTTNLLQMASRMGARYGTAEGVTSSDVQARVEEILSTIVDRELVEITVLDASVLDATGALPASPEDIASLPALDLDQAEPRQLFLVRATVAYNDIALIPFRHLEGVSFVGQSFSRHE